MKSKSQEIAEQYFNLSNESNFEEIAKLFTSTTTYSSQNTGIYLGSEDIITMQKDFHGRFIKLKWAIDSIKEIKPGIIKIEYSFRGEMKDGQVVESEGTETIVMRDGVILHVEIRNK